eukprot:9854729-Alexandrium_andersonii.AAC.1
MFGSAPRCAREGRLGLRMGGPAPVAPADHHHTGVAQGLVVQPVAGRGAAPLGRAPPHPLPEEL